MVAGATAWGLNALLPSWGYDYGYAYANPYYVQSAAPVYDYSQPIVVNNYNTPAGTTSRLGRKPPPRNRRRRPKPTSFSTRPWRPSRKATTRRALQLDQQALRKSPQDPVMHEVGALCMFAMGDYTGAAAVLDNLLAVAPGMDWTTLIGLYGDVDAYTAQLRALEAYCKQKPDDAASHFVLAYHYLVAGYNDAAADAAQTRRGPAARRPGGQAHARRH